MADDEWELQPVDSSPFEGRVTPPGAGNPYGNLSVDQLRSIGAPTMESYSPSLAQGLGDTANRGLQALGASKGYGQEFGSKLSGLAGLAPGIGDISAAQDSLKAGSPVGAAANVLGMFLGPGAKLANLGKLSRAMQLAKEGWDTDSIRMATGWHQGAEGGWRFEVPDTGLTVDRAKLRTLGNGDLSVPIGFVTSHPALMSNYPDLADYEIQTTPPGMSALGFHDPVYKTLGINKGLSQDEMRSTVAHELQHAVQMREGWEGGANSGAIKSITGLPHVQAFDIYRRNAGEVEARNTQKRLNMSALTRAAVSPTRTQDVPMSRQLLSSGNDWTLKPVVGNPFEEEQ